jgi:hypothetical protein
VEDLLEVDHLEEVAVDILDYLVVVDYSLLGHLVVVAADILDYLVVAADILLVVVDHILFGHLAVVAADILDCLAVAADILLDHPVVVDHILFGRLVVAHIVELLPEVAYVHIADFQVVEVDFLLHTDHRVVEMVRHHHIDLLEEVVVDNLVVLLHCYYHFVAYMEVGYLALMTY